MPQIAVPQGLPADSRPALGPTLGPLEEVDPSAVLEGLRTLYDLVKEQGLSAGGDNSISSTGPPASPWPTVSDCRLNSAACGGNPQARLTSPSHQAQA